MHYSISTAISMAFIYNLYTYTLLHFIVIFADAKGVYYFKFITFKHENVSQGYLDIIYAW